MAGFLCWADNIDSKIKGDIRVFYGLQMAFEINERIPPPYSAFTIDFLANVEKSAVLTC